jgi:hypothetical protein
MITNNHEITLHRDIAVRLRSMQSFDVQIIWNILIYLLTSLRSWALLEKLPIVQPLKNFPAFYGTGKCITVFTRVLHLSLSWTRSIQSIPSHPISLRSIVILTTHLRLGLPSGLFPSGFTTNILCAFPCPSHPPWLNLSNYVWGGVQVMKLLVM